MFSWFSDIGTVLWPDNMQLKCYYLERKKSNPEFNVYWLHQNLEFKYCIYAILLYSIWKPCSRWSRITLNLKKGWVLVEKCWIQNPCSKLCCLGLLKFGSVWFGPPFGRTWTQTGVRFVRIHKLQTKRRQMHSPSSVCVWFTFGRFKSLCYCLIECLDKRSSLWWWT
jgi:hypothetical protein